MQDLFLPPVAPASGAQPMTFRKGVVIDFDPATGENVINVAGSNLTNLPMLVSGSETTLVPGHTVGIAVVGTTMFILGRVALPGGPGYASTSAAFATSNNIADGFAVPNVYTTWVSTTLTVPPWASRAVLIATSDGNILSNQNVDVDLQWGVNIPGQPFGFGYAEKAPALSWAALRGANAITRTVTPGGTVSAEVRGLVTGPGFAANAGNAAVITLVGIFTSG